MQCGIDGQLSPCVHYINITALNTNTRSVLLLSETWLLSSRLSGTEIAGHLELLKVWLKKGIGQFMVRDYKPVDRTSNASGYNSKLPRFNSRFLQPGTEAVDAFSQDWSTENNWLPPPTVLIGRSLSHLSDCEVIGTLIVLMWKSVQFWLLLCDDGIHLNLFVTNCFFFLTDRIYLLAAGPRILCLVQNCSSPGVLHFVLTLLSTFVFPKLVFAQPPWGGVLFVTCRSFFNIWNIPPGSVTLAVHFYLNC